MNTSHRNRVLNTKNLSGAFLRLPMPDNGMRNSGIGRDDELIIVPQRNYRTGDIVAVRVGKQIYVRRLFLDRNYVYLEADDPQQQRLSIARNAPGIRFLGCVTRIRTAVAG